ncbi:hypothetical protein ADIMK_3072 [Marinobacterium lacunae]|uniref:Uncharacterized protein n=1 Tax=Marinobacterium lacunae TaxID=1232683 RepID=A0A081FVP5_9GAMM|nr:hypothetical protein [Marinobacterium lacunae]KEA62600.1 hypothetical protein ADIMK_3072 [Marinobacterium lacunae]MBR9882893.1 hypothetical protein [Oceanospirillales bacterium]
MDTTTRNLFERYQPLLEAAWMLGRETLRRSGIDSDMLPERAQFGFEPRQDPFTGEPTLNGRWAPADGQRRAQLVINADGSLMLECDLICPHPGFEGRWAEQISIWGRSASALKAEVSLLEQLGD